MNVLKTVGIGKSVPDFKGKSTQGDIDFPIEFSGEWVVLYSYVGDFLPTDATDILALDKASGKFRAQNARVIAMSPDSIATHIAWVRALRNQRRDGTDIGIPLVSDRMHEISTLYGVAPNQKTVFIIDDTGVLRSMHVYSPDTGINVTEILRALAAQRSAKAQNAQTPVNWTPGEDLLSPPPQTVAEANGNIALREAMGGQCLDFYICYTPDTGKRE